MANLGKVLLVDDDEVSNYISAHALQIANVTEQICVATNGREALELVKEASFDLVLLDTKMPVMDGFEFMEALQKLQKNSGITAPAIIILTTSEDPMDKARAMLYPIKGYLVKPLTQEQVNRLIDLIPKGVELAPQPLNFKFKMDFEQFERVCIVAAHYYLLPEAEPEPRHFEDWIESLQEPSKAIYRRRDFEGCRETLNFRRFVAELNDIGLEEYMMRHLSEADYRFWQQEGQ